MSDTEQDIVELIRVGESLTDEFKSCTNSLPDRDLVAAVSSCACRDP
ncbi:hypothetical protein [Vreelandella arcis]|uniref:Uncharacterized protein n=1 Tax=Vreelandella arcis TaxID=416873 RepID=A0A1H0CX22_9GAMM|nr:hypothetical protein [Halomonas arcis]SDN62418.1 hypothetical protein SAMN04487951_106229 [Halomonas arcis]